MQKLARITCVTLSLFLFSLLLTNHSFAARDVKKGTVTYDGTKGGKYPAKGVTKKIKTSKVKELWLFTSCKGGSGQKIALQQKKGRKWVSIDNKGSIPCSTKKWKKSNGGWTIKPKTTYRFVFAKSKKDPKKATITIKYTIENQVNG